MTPLDIWLATAGLAASGIIKGVTGIGYATCAMPLLAMVVGLETALAMVVVPALVSNTATMTWSMTLVHTARRFAPFYTAILPGIACGTLLLGTIDARIATHGLAVLTLAYVALALAKPRLAMPAALERPLALPAGFLNGILTGLTGSQILPLVPYMLALRLDNETQVQAINLAVAIAALALGAALLASNLMPPELLALSAAGALPAIAGTLIGNRLRPLVPVEALRRLTLAMLVLAALSLSGREAIEATLAAACGRNEPPAQSREVVSACLSALLDPMLATFDALTAQQPSP